MLVTKKNNLALVLDNKVILAVQDLIEPPACL